jgi:hypothetical protein
VPIDKIGYRCDSPFAVGADDEQDGRVLRSKRIRLTLDRNSHFDLPAERIRDRRRVQTRAHQVLDCIIFSRLYEAR